MALQRTSADDLINCLGMHAPVIVFLLVPGALFRAFIRQTKLASGSFMHAALILYFFTLWTAQTPSAQADHTAVAAPIAATASDPYAPLRLYDGKWDLVPASSGKPADAMHIENPVRKLASFLPVIKS